MSRRCQAVDGTITCRADITRRAVGVDAQNVVDQGRARREAELAAQYAVRQPTPVRLTTSVELGVTFRNLGVPCLVSDLRNERLPKDFKGPRKVPNYTAD